MDVAARRSADWRGGDLGAAGYGQWPCHRAVEFLVQGRFGGGADFAGFVPGEGDCHIADDPFRRFRRCAAAGVLRSALRGGAVLGVLWMQVFHTNSIGMYALLGACALLAASQQAPLMAICLVMELADAPINLFVPIGFAVAVSAFTASRLGEPLAALRLSKSAEKKVIKANAR